MTNFYRGITEELRGLLIRLIRLKLYLIGRVNHKFTRDNAFGEEWVN